MPGRENFGLEGTLRQGALRQGTLSQGTLSQGTLRQVPCARYQAALLIQSGAPRAGVKRIKTLQRPSGLLLKGREGATFIDSGRLSTQGEGSLI